MPDKTPNGKPTPKKPAAGKKPTPYTDAGYHDLMKVVVKPTGDLQFVFLSAAGEPVLIDVRADEEMLADLRAKADQAADLVSKAGRQADPKSPHSDQLLGGG